MKLDVYYLMQWPWCNDLAPQLWSCICDYPTLGYNLILFLLLLYTPWLYAHTHIRLCIHNVHSLITADYLCQQEQPARAPRPSSAKGSRRRHGPGTHRLQPISVCTLLYACSLLSALFVANVRLEEMELTIPPPQPIMALWHCDHRWSLYLVSLPCKIIRTWWHRICVLFCLQSHIDSTNHVAFSFYFLKSPILQFACIFVQVCCSVSGGGWSSLHAFAARRTLGTNQTVPPTKRPLNFHSFETFAHQFQTISEFHFHSLHEIRSPYTSDFWWHLERQYR